MDDILVYGGDKLIKKTNGKEFREYRVIKCDNGIIVKLVGRSFVKLLSFCHLYCYTDVWIHKLFLLLIILLTFSPLRYHYICRAYNDHVNSILETFIEDPPDIIVVNSCLWDLHR